MLSLPCACRLEAFDFCALEDLGRASCASRQLRDEAYDGALWDGARVGLELQRRFLKPRTVGEARYYVATAWPPQLEAAPRGSLVAATGRIVLGCVDSSVDDDDDEYASALGARPRQPARAPWVGRRSAQLVRVTAAQRLLDALAATPRFCAVEARFVAAALRGAYVARTRDAPAHGIVASDVVHLCCDHSSSVAIDERGGVRFTPADDVAVRAAHVAGLASLTCEYVVVDAALPGLDHLSVVALLPPAADAPQTHTAGRRDRADDASDAKTALLLQLARAASLAPNLAHLALRPPFAVLSPPYYTFAPPAHFLGCGSPLRRAEDLSAVTRHAKKVLPRLQTLAIDTAVFPVVASCTEPLFCRQVWHFNDGGGMRVVAYSSATQLPPVRGCRRARRDQPRGDTALY
ncbi:hypothetical protein M885DRAFT_620967 [Pelagophyceae sp. CCMP2097]|nr:hypothetical protein M885DRAFT_620967 [Pelagophyceae sp. CCMP2097]